MGQSHQKGLSVQFSDLHLSAPILKALLDEGYTEATPIQAQAIPPALRGQDILGSAQTGTGKTAAFAVPILQRLTHKTAGAAGRRPRCLVLCPTRELASQIADSFATYGSGLNLRSTTIFGGVGQHRQVEALRRGVDIVVATPGRLMDLMEQRYVDLSAIEILVLDEADRMLDMGFILPIRQIVAKLPNGRQTMMFSATMPSAIRSLADSLLRQPAVVQVAAVATPGARIEESVYRVEKGDKPALLAHLVQSLPMHRTIVFTRTKHGADRVVRHLHTRGIRAEAIHGNKSQNARQRALANFATDKIPVLVATDIASRGIDVDGITHVVNYDITDEPETYIHRIGRTARAGASGHAVSFCDREESSNLRAIERLTRRAIPTMPNPLGSSTASASEPSDRQSDNDNAGSHQRPRGQHSRDQHPHEQRQQQRSNRPFQAPQRSHSPHRPHNGSPQHAATAPHDAARQHTANTQPRPVVAPQPPRQPARPAHQAHAPHPLRVKPKAHRRSAVGHR